MLKQETVVVTENQMKIYIKNVFQSGQIFITELLLEKSDSEEDSPPLGGETEYIQIQYMV